MSDVLFFTMTAAAEDDDEKGPHKWGERTDDARRLFRRVRLLPFAFFVE